MSDDSPPREMVTPLSADAAAEWNRHVENVLRGVAHGLNNRAAALAALVELTSEPPEQPGVLQEILSGEQQRVRDLVRTVRTIGAPRGEVEPLLPADVVADLLVVLEHHPDFRDGVIQVDAAQGSPIRAPRSTFLRALISLAAGLTGGTRASPRLLVITTDRDWLLVAADGMAARTPTLAAELARQMGGDPLEDRYGMRLPTLAAIRRREGR